MVRLALDAGHGLNTPGKRCLKSLDKNETREWVLNSRIANYVQESLGDYEGIEVLRLDDTTGRVDVPLKTRTDKANSFNADILISIHHNAGINCGNGGGVVVYRYPSSLSKTKDYQKKLYDKVIKHNKLKGNRVSPLATGNFHITRESKMPALILENGFMDSKTDVPIILRDDHARKTASGIVEFLVEEFKLKKRPAKDDKLKDNQVYRVICGSFKSRKNAEIRQQELRKAGFDSFVVIHDISKE